MRPLQAWLAAIRPKTLGLSVSPVILGTALAVAQGHPFRPLPFVLALLAALLIQMGTNLHNDVADFRKGIDDDQRSGPPRATAQGWLSPRAVSRGAALAFGLALLLGVVLVWLGGWPIFWLGLASLVAGAAYSGGPWPISALPLGELFVFLFFGLVAVGGSHYLQSGHFDSQALVAGALLGLPAAAVLVVNNLRDRRGDARHGRRTLAVLLPPWASRVLYTVLVGSAFALLPWLLGLDWTLSIPGLLLPFAVATIRRLWRAEEGAAFNGVLAATARLQLGLGLATALALLLSG